MVMVACVAGVPLWSLFTELPYQVAGDSSRFWAKVEKPALI